MENFPAIGCGLLFATAMIQMGARKVSNELSDLKNCPSMKSVRVSDGESIYCHHRGPLVGSPPQVIKVSDRGDFSSHSLLLAQFRTHKITEKMVVEEKAGEGEKMSKKDMKKMKKKSKKKRVQKWVTEETLLEESPIKTAKSLLLDGINVNDFLPNLYHELQLVDTVFKKNHDKQVFLAESNSKKNKKDKGKKDDGPTVVINNSNNSGGFSSEGKYAHGAIGEGTKVDKGYKYRLFGVRDGDTYTVIGSYDGKYFTHDPSRFSTLSPSSYGTLVQQKESYLTFSRWMTTLGYIAGFGSIFYETRGLWMKKEER